jgi:hypothetical protein
MDLILLGLLLELGVLYGIAGFAQCHLENQKRKKRQSFVRGIRKKLT